MKPATKTQLLAALQEVTVQLDRLNALARSANRQLGRDWGAEIGPIKLSAIDEITRSEAIRSAILSQFGI